MKKDRTLTEPARQLYQVVFSPTKREMMLFAFLKSLSSMGRFSFYWQTHMLSKVRKMLLKRHLSLPYSSCRIMLDPLTMLMTIEENTI
jgi:hypothetical protein